MRITWQQEGVDRHRAWTVLALLGLAAGVALAVLGLPPVDWHGPLHRFGIMDPLCGATRGVRLTFLGDLAGAWSYNPAAPLLVAATLLVALRAGAGMLTGSWVTVRVGWTRRATIVTVLLIALLWANQQAHAALLLTRA